MGITSKRIAILGGGLAGCVLARRIGSMRRIAIDLFEREPRLGGSHRSVEIDGATFDAVPATFGIRHPLFAVFPALNDLFLEVEHGQRIISPSGSVDDFPLSLHSDSHENGHRPTARETLHVLASRAKYHRRESIPSFVRYYLGESVYSDSGLRDYLERCYAAPVEAIALGDARERLDEIVDLGSSHSTLIAGSSHPHASAHAVDRRFVRPRAGFDPVFAHIAENLRVEGVMLRLGAAIESIERVRGEFVVVAGGRTFHYDRIISTLSPASTASYLGFSNIGSILRLRGASLVSLFYRFHGRISEPGDVFHNFTREGSWRRIVMYSRRYGSVDGEQYFVVECVGRGTGDGMLGDAARDFESHLRTLAAFDGVARCVGGFVTPDMVPPADPGWRERSEMIERAIAAHGVDLAGRHGALRYGSSEAIVNAAQVMVPELDLRRERDVAPVAEAPGAPPAGSSVSGAIASVAHSS